MIVKHLGESIAYWCPGCKMCHSVPKARWSYNGDDIKPTLSPSVRHFYTLEDSVVTTCHYFIQQGYIVYCSDSPHEFAGKTVPMEDIPEDYGFSA